jgi:hypothetical protein
MVKKHHSGTKCLGVSIGSAEYNYLWFNKFGRKNTNTPKNKRKQEK